MIKLLVIAAGGAIGAVCRYSLSGFVHKYSETTFPWGTLVVNVLGCFLIGLLTETFSITIVPQHVRTLFLVGMLGAFTTFSTFGLETVNLIRDAQLQPAVLNLVLSNSLGVIMVFFGIFSARLISNLLH